MLVRLVNYNINYQLHCSPPRSGCGRRRRFDNRLAVEEANDRFYAAFTSGNLPGMASIWGKGEQVQCIHPGSACIAGREGVLQSWKLVLAAGRMKISLEDVRIFAGER